MIEKYENQEAVDAIQRRLDEIAPGVEIGSYHPERKINSFGILEDRIVSVGITIPVKGNAKVIRRLEEEGWEKTWRERTRNYDAPFSSSSYSGYAMMQRMQLSLED